jgi:hypothetical protein
MRKGDIPSHIYSMILLSHLATMKNMGDNGHPCLRPLEVLENCETSPFTKTRKEEELKKSST